MRFLVIIFLMVLGFSCKKNEKPIEVKIERFDQKLMNVKDRNELNALLTEDPDYSRSLYRTSESDTSLQSHLYSIITHKDTRKLYEETQKKFGNLGDIELEFSRAFTNIKAIYPDFRAPRIMATFTGLSNDLFVSDSLVIISLEAFLGPKGTYRPQQPNYILRRYDKPYIVPTVINFLSASYNKTSESDNTILADMIYFGKSYEFTKQVLAPIPDSLVIGYSEKDLRKSWYSQKGIWNYFVSKQLLYDKSPREKRRYLEERPTVNEISEECPGRIGQWLGWRIIQSYLEENPRTTLKELMEIEDPQEILKGSKYRGDVEDYART